jgi:hypothetical protein
MQCDEQPVPADAWQNRRATRAISLTFKSPSAKPAPGSGTQTIQRMHHPQQVAESRVLRYGRARLRQNMDQ